MLIQSHEVLVCQSDRRVITFLFFPIVDTTKMTAKALGIVFGPNIFR